MDLKTMQTKKYRGFAVKAPPHLNRKLEPNRYVFSGVAIESGEFYSCSFRVIPLPGFTTPEKFAADVTAQNSVPGRMEVFPPDWKLGQFNYGLPGTGTATGARADDMMQLSKEQLMPPPKVNPLGGESPPPPKPELPKRGPERDMF